MTLLLRIPAVALAFILCGSSLVEYRAQSLSDQGVAALEASRAKAAVLPGDAIGEQATQRLARAADAAFSSVESKSRYAALLFEQAERVDDESRQVKYLCSALGQLALALREAPFQPSLLVRWASIRRLLAGIECAEPGTGGDYREVIDLALEQGRSDIRAIYAAALLLLTAGERERAFRLFSEVLTFDTNLSSAQRELIFRQVHYAEDLRAAIPARFPEILHFLTFLRENPEYSAGRSSQGWAGELAELEIEAIDRSRRDWLSGAAPGSLHLNRLSSLLNEQPSSAVRRRVDREMAAYWAEQQRHKLAQYLSARSLLDTLVIVPAAVTTDTKPLKSALIGWNEKRAVWLDEFFASLGFFLGEGQGPVLIELVSDAAVPLREVSMLRIYVSSDNSQWKDITGDLEIQTWDDSKSAWVSLAKVPQYFPYWKIHFASNRRARSFRNRLDRILRVYGRADQREKTG